MSAVIDTGNFNRAERVSRVDERIALAMPYPAFILPTYADKGERRRTRKVKIDHDIKRLWYPTTYAHVRIFAANQQQNLLRLYPSHRAVTPITAPFTSSVQPTAGHVPQLCMRIRRL